MNRAVDKKHHRILTGCITLSLALHTAFIAFLQTHSLWFYSNTPHDFTKSTTPWTELIEKQTRDQILEQTFESTERIAKTVKTLTPQLEKEELKPLPIQIASQEPPFSQQLTVPFPLENLLAQNSIFPIRSFSLPALKELDLFTDLPKDLIVPTIEKKGAELIPQTEMMISSRLASDSISLPSPPSIPLNFSQTLANPTPIDPDQAFAKVLPQIAVPNLPQLPTLAELDTANLSSSFESELVFLPREDGPGYIFALTLIPRHDLKIDKIKQNITFLIDKSNTIQRERLHASKLAVQKALQELSEDDTFNIFVFDSKVEKLFPTQTPATTTSFEEADRFLDQIQLGSFFSPADLYRPLLLTLPANVEQDELYTTILITDGECFSKKNTTRALLQNWTAQNSGKASLYTIAMGTDHHLAALDALSVFNRGNLSYATTNRGLRRKVLKVMKTIRTPIAKNMTVNAICRSPNNHIILYPKPESAPHLYQDQPYVIFGVTETLDDFILFVQGKLKNQWLNIKKPISFLSAKKGGHTLKAEWALQKAYRHYEEYVIDENPNHLTEARAILEPFDLMTAFQ